MKPGKPCEWLAAAANFGVILGIIFLVIQISQPTKATVAAANDEADMSGRYDYSHLRTRTEAA